MVNYEIYFWTGVNCMHVLCILWPLFFNKRDQIDEKYYYSSEQESYRCIEITNHKYISVLNFKWWSYAYYLCKLQECWNRRSASNNFSIRLPNAEITSVLSILSKDDARHIYSSQRESFKFQYICFLFKTVINKVVSNVNKYGINKIIGNVGFIFIMHAYILKQQFIKFMKSCHNKTLSICFKNKYPFCHKLELL